MAYGQSSTLVVKKDYPRKIQTNQALGKMKIKSYDTKNLLSSKQVEALQKHSKKHSAKHIKMMVNKMTKLGYSFAKSHTTTLMKYGK
tara:strand:+ start:1783 stop:2043 length:261 start_codon:yes stop_codon:yes gene_type:complete